MTSTLTVTPQMRDDLNRALDAAIVDIQSNVFGKYADQDGYTREDQVAARAFIDRLADIYDLINENAEAGANRPTYEPTRRERAAALLTDAEINGILDANGE